MAENKTKPTKVAVEYFITTVSEQRAGEARLMIDMMERISGEPAVMWGPSIIGFGSYHYTYASGHEGDMPLIAFSPRKSKLVLYITEEAVKYAAILARLGKHSTSKACIYINKLADIDRTVLEELIRVAYKDALK